MAARRPSSGAAPAFRRRSGDAARIRFPGCDTAGPGRLTVQLRWCGAARDCCRRRARPFAVWLKNGTRAPSQHKRTGGPPRGGRVETTQAKTRAKTFCWPHPVRHAFCAARGQMGQTNGFRIANCQREGKCRARKLPRQSCVGVRASVPQAFETQQTFHTSHTSVGGPFMPLEKRQRAMVLRITYGDWNFVRGLKKRSRSRPPGEST